MDKCPVCHNPIPVKSNKCPKCAFDVLQQDFINQSDAEYWYHSVVLPYRANWLSTLSGFRISGLCLDKYIGKDTVVVLPFGITRIEDAFRNNKTLTTVVIPESVTVISDCAFQGCENLTTVVLPNSLAEIRTYAFDGCTSLKSVDLPQNLQMICGSAFKECNSLEEIHIPQSVAWVDDDIFENCSSLKMVHIGEKTEIHHKNNDAFKGCDAKLQIIRYPHRDSEPSIPAFWSDNSEDPLDKFWDEFTPGYGRTIEKYLSAHKEVLDNSSCFIAKGNLISYVGNEAEITIPEGVFSIGNLAFAFSTVEKVVIPSTVKVIYPEAFLHCKKLKEVVLPHGLREVAYGTFMNSSLEHIAIPSTVYKIDAEAFQYTRLKSLTIPDSVTEIGTSAFGGCKDLEEVKLPNELTYLKSGVFSQCKKLKSINLPDNLRVFGGMTFHSCESLTEVVIPEKVITLGVATFHSCINLKKINIPRSITHLNGSFANCKALEEIHLPLKLQKISSVDFYGCSNLKKVCVPRHLRYSGYGNDTRFRGCHESLTVEYY